MEFLTRREQINTLMIIGRGDRNACPDKNVSKQPVVKTIKRINEAGGVKHRPKAENSINVMIDVVDNVKVSMQLSLNHGACRRSGQKILKKKFYQL